MKLFLGLIARLPERVAYGLATAGYGLLYHVLRYRRAVVEENLRCAFPERDREERRRIEKDFYRHLCNLVVEVIRSAHMERETFAERVRIRNVAVLEEATDNYARQAIVLLIHQGNWEWLLHSAMAQLPVPVDPVYKPLHSPFWEDFMLRARSRFGANPMTISSVGREVIRGRKRQRIIGMVADQTGPRQEGYWTEFLHRPASFYRGADKLAQTLKVPVILAQCHRMGRGYYEMEFHTISLPPHDPDGEVILDRYIRKAEELIRQSPETYLWSNRRWKKPPPEDSPVVPEPIDGAPSTQD